MAGMGVSVCGIMMMMMIMGAAAQAPAPSVDCQTEVLTLSDCLTFVTGSDKAPSATCCSELSSVVSSSPQCLCLLFNTSFTEPLGVNVTLAQQLPPLCKVQTPPTSLCSLLGVPVSGPVSSPATAPVIAPVVAPAPASIAPAPSVDCQAEVLTLSDCLTFVTGSDKVPSAACCSELSSTVSSSPQCLCLLFNTSFTEPLGVNVTLAQQLPPLCKVQTPPTSLCSLLGVPVPGPVTAPTPAMTPSSVTPAGSMVPSSSSNATTTPTAPAPNSAPPISSKNVAVAANLLFLASIFLS